MEASLIQLLHDSRVRLQLAAAVLFRASGHRNDHLEDHRYQGVTVTIEVYSNSSYV